VTSSARPVRLRLWLPSSSDFDETNRLQFTSSRPPKAPEGWRTTGRFAKFDRHRKTRQRPGLRWPSTALTRTQTKRRGAKNAESRREQKEFSALLRALRVSAFILSAVCKLAFRPSGVAASQQSAAFFPSIFRWRLSPESRYASNLAGV
jgi:hypothetical protein